MIRTFLATLALAASVVSALAQTVDHEAELARLKGECARLVKPDPSSCQLHALVVVGLESIDSPKASVVRLEFHKKYQSISWKR